MTIEEQAAKIVKVIDAIQDRYYNETDKHITKYRKLYKRLYQENKENHMGSFADSTNKALEEVIIKILKEKSE